MTPEEDVKYLDCILWRCGKYIEAQQYEQAWYWYATFVDFWARLRFTIPDTTQGASALLIHLRDIQKALQRSKLSANLLDSRP